MRAYSRLTVLAAATLGRIIKPKVFARNGTLVFVPAEVLSVKCKAVCSEAIVNGTNPDPVLISKGVPAVQLVGKTAPPPWLFQSTLVPAVFTVPCRIEISSTVGGACPEESHAAMMGVGLVLSSPATCVCPL